MPKSKRSGTTQRFNNKTTFRNWLKRNNYTKDASPGTGVYNSRGQRIGEAFVKGSYPKQKMEVSFY